MEFNMVGLIIGIAIGAILGAVGGWNLVYFSLNKTNLIGDDEFGEKEIYNK